MEEWSPDTAEPVFKALVNEGDMSFELSTVMASGLKGRLGVLCNFSQNNL